VAYAVAKQLGFDASAVTWTKVPFNSSYAPGPKKFDFDINQISITPERAKVVDFSDGYYTAAQAVIALKDSPAAKATTLADLKDLKLGAQTGTTSLTAIRNDIQPSAEPLVFQSTNVAKQALLNGQVDAIVADLPTAFYISAVQIPSSTIVGQFQQQSGSPEQFGMLFQKDNPLVGCVNQALATMKGDGTLDAIEKKWLSQTVNVPVLR
jgi:polar amino acid transport system substrate-binding protein